jgi:polyphenol oxidase
VIGPHIGPCCYEVDEPVIAAVTEPAALRPGRRQGRAQLDLRELNRRQLVRAGIPESAVLHVPGCTACDAAYASYRRDRTSERMLHYIQMPGALPSRGRSAGSGIAP